MAATLLQLRNRVLIMLNDLQDPLLGSGDRYKIFNLNQTINDVIHHYERYLNSFYQGYLTSTIPVNLLANITSYALGPTFRSPIYEVRRTINEVDYFLNPILTYNGIISTIPVSNEVYLPSYHLEGNTIIFAYPPTSNETAAIRVKFQGKLTDLVLDTDTLNDQLFDAEDCIVTKSAIRALKAKDVSGGLKNISGWEGELAQSEKSFFMQVGNRYVKPDKPIPIEYMSDFYF